MSQLTKEIGNMVNMLPEKEQELAYELIKRIVLAWDSEFTMLTPQELDSLRRATQEIQMGDVISHEDIDWE